MPRTSTPRMSSPWAISDWPLTKGAAPTTSGCAFTRCSSAGTSCRPLPSTLITSMCDTTPSMRSRTSFWKPFMTDSTMISAATPSAMPTMDAAEMKEMNPLRRVERPARV